MNKEDKKLTKMAMVSIFLFLGLIVLVYTIDPFTESEVCVEWGMNTSYTVASTICYNETHSCESLDFNLDKFSCKRRNEIIIRGVVE